MIIREACVDSIQDALLAQTNGADQLEWCGKLSEDGLTPDFPITLELLKMIKIPVKIMIRCRSGDFIYTEEEMKIMTEDARKFSVLSGISGLVFGACTKDNTLNIRHISEIVMASNGKSITVHKAIDTCKDILLEVRNLQNLKGVDYILSSGGAHSALEGSNILLAMKSCFEGNVIAAGKINHKNLETLHQKIAFTYYHGRHIVH